VWRSALLLGAVVVAGCSVNMGILYEDVAHPPVDILGTADKPVLVMDPNVNASIKGRTLTKSGTACSADVLKLIAWGDSSQAAAAKAGSVTKLNAVDTEVTAFLALVYTRVCITVSGE